MGLCISVGIHVFLEILSCDEAPYRNTYLALEGFLVVRGVHPQKVTFIAAQRQDLAARLAGHYGVHVLDMPLQGALALED